MNWILVASLSSILFGLYNFFLKYSADKIHPVLATLVLTMSAAIVSLIALIILKITGAVPSFDWTRDGLKFAILSGVASGLGEILFFYLFSKGSPIIIGLPFVFALTVLTGVFLGIIILHEPINLPKIIGIIFTLIGVIILSRF